ncbi:MAG TPA: response regulator, partial [Acidobacteriota bacterium]|nr:response regulator [Acidobacteriota bacterium]
PFPAPSEVVQNGSETILVAEDEPEILSLVERVLKQVGYRVITADNGENALRKAEAHPGAIHLLLTDAVMPVLDGRELIERLRPLRPNMKVLIMSGYTDSGILYRAVAGQDVAFLPKPFTPNQLARKVQEVLQSS